jgi:hypothetical protein
MRVSQLIVTAATGALAAALAFGAVPASARPEDGDHDRGQRAERSQGNGGGWQARQQQQAQPTQQAAPQVQAAPRQQWQQRQQTQQTQPAQQWQGRQQGDAQRQQWQAQRQAQVQQQQVQQQQVQRQQWQGRQQADRQQTQQVQRQQWQQRQQTQQQGLQPWEAQQQRQQQQQARDWNDRRNGTYTDRNRSGSYGAYDRNRTQDAYRNGTRYQNNQYAYRNGTRDNQRWDRSWRNNNRYDWQRYRQTNRYVFNLGTYYSPYNNYSYRRIGIGSVLAQLFYGQNYWIDDPWQYRLPDVYGPYRWVRYYDDALLVDIYSGEVVDVIYDFFW